MQRKNNFQHRNNNGGNNRNRNNRNNGGNNRNNNGGGRRFNVNHINNQLEKYNNQARDALHSGDRVKAEYFYQHAEHWQRLLNEANEEMASRQPQSAPYEGEGDEAERNGRDDRRDEADDVEPRGDENVSPRNAENRPREPQREGQREGGRERGEHRRERFARRGAETSEAPAPRGDAGEDADHPLGFALPGAIILPQDEDATERKPRRRALPGKSENPAADADGE